MRHCRFIRTEGVQLIGTQCSGKGRNAGSFNVELSPGPLLAVAVLLRSENHDLDRHARVRGNVGALGLPYYNGRHCMASKVWNFSDFVIFDRAGPSKTALLSATMLCYQATNPDFGVGGREGGERVPLSFPASWPKCTTYRCSCSVAVPSLKGPVTLPLRTSTPIFTDQLSLPSRNFNYFLPAALASSSIKYYTSKKT